MSTGPIIPIVDITCFGINVNVDTYAKNAIEWAKRELVPRESIYCPCLNEVIYLSNSKIRHTINQKKYDQQGNYNIDTIAVLSELEAIIKNAKIRYTANDRKNRRDVNRIIMLMSKVSINDQIRDVEVVIQEIYDSQIEATKYHFYNHVLL